MDGIVQVKVQYPRETPREVLYTKKYAKTLTEAWETCKTAKACCQYRKEEARVCMVRSSYTEDATVPLKEVDMAIRADRGVHMCTRIPVDMLSQWDT